MSKVRFFSSSGSCTCRALRARAAALGPAGRLESAPRQWQHERGGQWGSSDRRRRRSTSKAWKREPHLARIKPLAQDWAVNGVGVPGAVYLLYLVKLVVFLPARRS